MPAADTDGGRQLACPLCRAPFRLADLWGLQQQLSAAYQQLYLQHQQQTRGVCLPIALSALPSSAQEGWDVPKDGGSDVVEGTDDNARSTHGGPVQQLCNEVSSALSRFSLHADGSHPQSQQLPSNGPRLSAQELAPWKQVQVQHAMLFAAQLRKGGIIQPC